MICRRRWGTMCLSRSLCYWSYSSPSRSSKFQKQKTNLQRKLLICSKLHQHGGKQRMTHPSKICLRKKIISNLTTVTFNHWVDHLVFWLWSCCIPFLCSLMRKFTIPAMITLMMIGYEKLTLQLFSFLSEIPNKVLYATQSESDY